MKKDNMMTMVMVVGGLGLAYWYLTRYGPNGAAHNAAGQQIAPTWWDTWFGGAVAPAQVTSNVPPTQSSTPGGSTQPPPSTTVNVRTKLLTAAGGVTSLNADQWNYYRNSLFPPALTPEQFGAAFPSPTTGMSVDDFLNALKAGGINAANPNAGVSGVVPAQPIPQIPSMSFGGSLATARPRLSPSVFRNRPVGSGGFTIQ